MFAITLNLAFETMRGVQALDFCRQYGLADTSPVLARSSSPSVSTEVDEKFARSWFEIDQTSDHVVVIPEMLVPGEMQIRGGYLMFAELPPERIRELYIAGKFRELNR